MKISWVILCILCSGESVGEGEGGTERERGGEIDFNILGAEFFFL